MRKCIVAIACLLMSGCMATKPCQETWTKLYNAKGQVMYVLEESDCVSVKFKEAYQ